MTDFNKRNWTLDITCTLVATVIGVHGLLGIHNAVNSLTRPQVAAAQSAATEDPLEALRHDPTTAGAFEPIAAAAETEELWRSKDELAVDTIAWHDGPLTKIHRH